MRKALALFVVLLCLSVANCATSKGVMIEDSVHDALARVDDQERAFCKAPENVDKFKTVCADLNPVIIASLEAGAAFNRGVAGQKAISYASLVEALGKLASELKKLPSGATVQMFIDLAKALGAASGQFTANGGK